MAGMMADSRDYAGFDRELVRGNGTRKIIRRKMKRVESRNWRRDIRQEGN